MPMMRPRSPTPLPLRTALRPLVAALSAALSATLALGGLLALAGCSNDGSLGLPVPPKPDVPEVAHDSYPTIGTTTRTGRQPLTEPQRARLQSDLEHLSHDRGAAVQATIRKNANAQNETEKNTN